MDYDFSDLKATFVNCTLKRSPERSHTQGLVDASAAIMRKHGVEVTELRLVDHDVATGCLPGHAGPRLVERRLARAVPGDPGQRHPRGGRADLAGRQLQHHQAADREALLTVRGAQREGAVPLLRPGRRLPHHRQRGRHQALRPEHPVLACSTSATRSRPTPTPAGSARPVPGRRTSTRQRRPRERLHQPQHHLHDVEPDAPGQDAQGRPAVFPATATSARSGTPGRGSTSRTPSTAPDQRPGRIGSAGGDAHAPGHAEAVGEQAEAGAPGGVGEGLDDPRAVGELVPVPLGLIEGVRVDGDEQCLVREGGVVRRGGSRCRRRGCRRSRRGCRTP